MGGSVVGMRRVAVLVVAVVLGAGCAFVERVSVDSNEVQQLGIGINHAPSISSDGRYVAFDSTWTQLVPGDTNGTTDVFVRDTKDGTTTRISVASSASGAQGNSWSQHPTMSASGRYVAFVSNASNLVTGDTNGVSDVFVRDLQTNTTTLASVHTNGTQGDGQTNYSDAPSISADGRFVGFSSNARNLVTSTSQVFGAAYLRDMVNHTTVFASITLAGKPASVATSPAISNNGRYVAFSSNADDLVVGDTDSVKDVFVRDMSTGTNSMVSVSTNGVQQAGNSTAGTGKVAMSADARFVVFRTLATTLIDGVPVTNGQYNEYVRDRSAGTTSLVNVNTAGQIAGPLIGGAILCDPAISADGRYITFDSSAANLVAGDSNNTSDVFVRDLVTHRTTRVSTSGTLGQTNGISDCSSISADGRYVAFFSQADNIVTPDVNGRADFYVRANPVPTITSPTSVTVARGASKKIDLTGTYFLTGSTGVNAYFGEGITISAITRTDEQHVSFTITVAPTAATGARTVLVYDPGTKPDNPTATGAAASFSLTVT